MRKRLTKRHLLANTVSVWRFCLFVAKRFAGDGCSYSAASLTITSLLTFVPLLAIGLKVLSILPVYDKLAGKVQDFIFSNFVAGASDATNTTIQHYLQVFAKQATTLSVFGLLALFVMGVLLMHTIGRVLNLIWRARLGWHNLAAMGRYVLVLLLVPVLISGSIFASSYLISVPFFSQGIEHLRFLHVLPITVSFVAFMLLYMAIPNYRVRWRDASIAALVAALLFEAAKSAFGFYVVHFTRYEVLYGAFASLPIFLIWLYFSWMIILLGAEIAHALGLRYQFTAMRRLDPFTQAYNWLGLLYRAQAEGKKLDVTSLLKQDKKAYRLAPDEMLTHLHKAGYIRQGYNGKIQLRCNLDNLTLFDLYHGLPWRLPIMDDRLRHIWPTSCYQRLQQADQQLHDVLDLKLAQYYKNN